MKTVLFALALLLGFAGSSANAQFGTMLYSAPAGSGCGGFLGVGDLSLGTWSFWGGLRAFSCATTGTKSANVCNAADANCADVNTVAATGNFDTTAVQAAPLNCGGAGGTCTIKTLYDKSGNGLDLTQATIASRPTLAFNCINTTLPCMIVNGQQLTSGSSIASGAAPQNLTAVAMQTGTPSGIGLLSGDNGVAAGIEFSSPATVRVFCQAGAAGVTETDNVFHGLIGVCVTGASASSLTLDGVTTTATTTPTNATGFPAQIGPGWIGKIVESGFVEGGSAFTGPQITTLCHNQRLYWGTGGTC